MITQGRRFPLAVAVTTVIWLGGQALAGPTNIAPGTQIDPAPGMPAGSGSGFISPATGMPPGVGRGLPAEERAREQADQARASAQVPLPWETPADPNSDQELLLRAQTMTTGGQYAAAMECFQKIYAKARTNTNSVLLETALPDWVKLGNQFPDAKQRLIDIRDQDARSFAQDSDSLPLFLEVSQINTALGDDGATVELFKGMRRKNSSQADGWYLYVEPALVRRGEYQLCLDCIGNPEGLFDTYCYTFKRLQAFNEDMITSSIEERQKAEAVLRQPDGPSPFPYPHVNPGKRARRLTGDNYANEVCRLIEILIGTGHTELAEKIQGDAVAVLDDPRLHSAASDAEAKIQKRSVPPVAAEGK